MSEDMEDMQFILDELLSDSTIPKNVKQTLTIVKTVLTNNNKDVVKLSDVIYKLQDVSEDVNLPLNAKSDIWLLQSKIEKLKESVK